MSARMLSFCTLPAKGGLARITSYFGRGIGRPGCGERVVVLDARAFELVQVEVEDGDLHHVGVVVEAGEGVLF